LDAARPSLPRLIGGHRGYCGCVQVDYRGGDEIDVFAGVHPGMPRPDGPVKASSLGYGLVDALKVSPWFLHFFAATTHFENGLVQLMRLAVGCPR
jgi:hypothetical protein